MKMRFYATTMLMVTLMVAAGCAQKASYSGAIEDEELEVVVSGDITGMSGSDADGASATGNVGSDGSSGLNTTDSSSTQDSTSSSASSSTSSSASSSTSSSATATDDDRQTDSLLDQRLVFFDFDQSTVREEFLPLLTAHADFLVRNPGLGVILEGHADNRGSNEYNLALGQRRANAVRDILLSSGVSLSQIETLSFGEEEPRAYGNNEEAWAENRRVEIRYNDE